MILPSKFDKKLKYWNFAFKRKNILYQNLVSARRFQWHTMRINSNIKMYPFLRSSKTLLIYSEFPKLFSQKRKALSSLEIWASSGKVSRKDICFVWVESPFLNVKENKLSRFNKNGTMDVEMQYIYHQGKALTCAGKYVQQKRGSGWASLRQCLWQSSISCNPSSLHVPALASLFLKTLSQPMRMAYCAQVRALVGGVHKLLRPTQKFNVFIVQHNQE